VTGKGTDSSGEEVNLPQTGYSDIYKVVIILAVLMTVSGVVIVVKTKKETE
jgi:LPXTG-motif cell wall-anchored protein